MAVQDRSATSFRSLSESLRFLIVGTPRSGTTLVQRLASELPGVAVPPETHFFWEFGPTLMRTMSFPLDAKAIAESVARFNELESSRGLEVDARSVVEQLDGHCRDAFELFTAVVRDLAGEATLYGEKTPRHLMWMEKLIERFPHLKLVAVVRDARAVIASNLEVPWGMKSHVALAERWRIEQKQVAATLDRIGNERMLVLRYEDVVRDPAEARARLAHLLNVGRPRTRCHPIASKGRTYSRRGSTGKRDRWGRSRTNAWIGGRRLSIPGRSRTSPPSADPRWLDSVMRTYRRRRKHAVISSR